MLRSLLLFQCIWTFLAAPASSTVLTGCQQCEYNNKCDLAYRNTPGIYCGHWLSSGQVLGCCCPSGARCVLNTYSCACDTNTASVSSNGGLIGGIIGGMVFVCFTIALCVLCKKSCRAYNKAAGNIVPNNVTIMQQSPVPLAQPVGYPVQQYPQQGYPMQQPPPGYAMQAPQVVQYGQPQMMQYPPQPQVYVHPQAPVMYPNQNTGFINGMILGGALADIGDGFNHHHHHHDDGGGFGGDSGFGGGDFGGGGGADCGGDF